MVKLSETQIFVKLPSIDALNNKRQHQAENLVSIQTSTPFMTNVFDNRRQFFVQTSFFDKFFRIRLQI